MKLNILPVRADYHHRELSYREKFEIYLGGVNRGDVGGEESRVQTVSWSSKVTHTSWVCSPQKRWPPDPLTTPQPAPPHTHTPTHSHQLHLHLRFSSVASQQTEGGSGNHRGDRDSAFVSPDPLWENSVWPPWPSGCGVCVRAGNHCMMTMPYVIRHKLTFCPQEEHSLAFVLRRPTPRRVWGCGDERLDERASLLPRDDLEIVTQWFTSVQVELSLSPCLDLKKHPDDLLIRHVSPCVVTGVCFHWSVCAVCWLWCGPVAAAPPRLLDPHRLHVFGDSGSRTPATEQRPSCVTDYCSPSHRVLALMCEWATFWVFYWRQRRVIRTSLIWHFSYSEKDSSK